MTPYLDKTKNSGIAAYEIGIDYIRVQFKDNDIYLYTYESTHPIHIEEMKKLALQGQGLNTYISQNVKKNYADKE